jgi:hypothetical protein
MITVAQKQAASRKTPGHPGARVCHAYGCNEQHCLEECKIFKSVEGYTSCGESIAVRKIITKC